MINNLDLGKKVIKDKIPLLSKSPGVYRMLSSKKEILYNGKAKNIPNRLRNYVSDKNLPIRTERMLSQTKFLETTTTSNESPPDNKVRVFLSPEKLLLIYRRLE
jgi:excinuclease ABC subunit C